MSALIYEVVWFRMLTRTIGNTVYATSTVLAVFMLGLAVGSFYFGRRADRTAHPLRLYALLEGGIVVAALVMPVVFAFITEAYASLAQRAGDAASLLPVMRIVLCVVCLLVPTTLMGATFPVMNRAVVRDLGHVGRRVTFLYGINTTGAVLGAGLAGFVLIAVWGEATTTYLAIACNIIAAAAALLISRLVGEGTAVAERAGSAAQSASVDASRPNRTTYLLFAVVFIAGFTSLAYEVLWTRILTVFLGTSIYAFSTILVLFLGGIAFGSLIISRMMDRGKDLLTTLGVVMFLIGVCSVVVQYVFHTVGQNPGATALSRNGIQSWTNLGSFFISSATAMLIVTVLFGMAFPLALKIAVKELGSLGRRLGSMYAANTVGAVIGPLVAGFLMIPILGTHRSVMALALVSASLGIVMVAREGKLAQRQWAAILLAGTAAMAALMLASRDPFLGALQANLKKTGYRINYHNEDADATVTVAQRGDSAHARQLFINGSFISSISGENFLIGHLPMMMHPHPQDVLVMCLGIGTSYKSTLLYPVRADAVEISNNVVEAFLATDPQASDVIANPRGRIVVEDGRAFLLTTDRRYDVITIDASPPLYSAGTVNLLTNEFFNLAKDRLKPGGQLMLWIPTSSATVEDFRMILKTYASVFEHVSLWGLRRGSGVLIFGSDEPIAFDRDRVATLIAENGIGRKLWGRQINPQEGAGQLATLFMMDDEAARRFAGDAEFLTDDHPYTEFPLFRRTSRSRRMLNAELFPDRVSPRQ